MSSGALAATLGALADEVLSDSPSTPGIVIAVHQADEGVVAVARGVADPATAQPLTPDHAVRIASCTKTFVASTVLVLAGRGDVDLDHPLVEALPAAVAAQFTAFQHHRTATVRQVLQHRSGLVEHPAFPEFELGPRHRWTAAEQIAIAMAHPPLLAPGTAFAYSDTGYVLLGQVIEHVTGLPLAHAVRTTLGLDPAEYPSIHWEVVEPTPPGLVRAHQLHGEHDTYDWDPSLDLFGGGGIVATMPDLARWWTALFSGRVHPHLVEQTGSTAPSVPHDGSAFPGGLETGLGMFHRVVDGVDVWSHGGYWGLQTLHLPALGTSVALTVNRRGEGSPTPGTVADRLIGRLAR